MPDTLIHELIEIVLKESGYGNYAAAMPAGARRRANLRMLVEKAIAYENTSYKGLFHFVRYIDELRNTMSILARRTWSGRMRTSCAL